MSLNLSAAYRVEGNTGEVVLREIKIVRCCVGVFDVQPISLDFEHSLEADWNAKTICTFQVK